VKRLKSKIKPNFALFGSIGPPRLSPFRGWHPNKSPNVFEGEFCGWIYKNTGHTIT